MADEPVKVTIDCETGEVTTEPMTAADKALAAKTAAEVLALTDEALRGAAPAGE